MFDKLFVFGDSFMYGEESHQHEFEQQQFIKDASSAVGRTIKLDKNGVPATPFTAAETNKYIKFINEMIPKSGVHPNDNSIGALLSKQLNIPMLMHAQSGNSNNTIYKTFIDCLPDMTENSLVIFGISQTTRKSYYEGDWIERHKYKHVTSCWADVTSKPSWEKYQELDIMFGDDATARVLQTYSYVTSAKSLCPGKILFIDPFHQFCDNKYHPDIPLNYVRSNSFDFKNYKHHNLLDHLEKEFKNLFCYGISKVFEEVESDGYPIQCINGHYSKYTYEKYVEQIILKHESL